LLKNNISVDEICLAVHWAVVFVLGVHFYLFFIRTVGIQVLFCIDNDSLLYKCCYFITQYTH